jgi:hypothetical protein
MYCSGVGECEVHHFSRLVSWWTTTLCFAIWSPLKNLFLHRERRCGHVYLSFLGQRVQLGFVFM